MVARFESLRNLDGEAEALLRLRALERPRDVEASLQQMRRALEAGKIYGTCLYDEANTARGITLWRWNDSHQAYAQVLVLYIPPVVTAALGAALVRHLFDTLSGFPSLVVIEARLRDQPPGVRETWAALDFAFFERCRTVRLLQQPPIPVIPTPKNYHVVRWEDSHQESVESLAAEVYAGSIDAIAVPDTQPLRIVKVLRRLRAGEGAGAEVWNADASLVVLDKRERVVGYVAVVLADGNALVSDLAVHPSHRRKGLARLLLVRSMSACQKQGLPSISLAVTTRHPVRALGNQLGFQATDCGEVALWWRDGRQLPWRAGGEGPLSSGGRGVRGEG